jgi:hypothetical protein
MNNILTMNIVLIVHNSKYGNTTDKSDKMYQV